MSRFAFVLMPFSQEFTDIYESGIKAIAKDYNVKAERVDEQIYDNDMLNQIYGQIDKADFIIADMSGRNANVFYEVGYADAKKKLIILLTQDTNDIPFDLKHRPHVVYEGSIKRLKEELGSRIAWAVKEIESRNEKPISATLKVRSTQFVRTETTDAAELSYSLELANLTESKIKGLEFIYLHTGPSWTFFKEAKALKSSKSEISPFPIRHLLSPDFSMIPQKDSVQLDFTGKKILWSQWQNKDGPRPDEYLLQGRIVIVVHTEQHTQRFDVNVDSKATYSSYEDDIPF